VTGVCLVQIPKEGAAFRQTDAIWRSAMENTKLNPLVMTVADMPNLLENFQQVTPLPVPLHACQRK
jgi:hypothetical protein